MIGNDVPGESVLESNPGLDEDKCIATFPVSGGIGLGLFVETLALSGRFTFRLNASGLGL